jgi:alpha-mannosidase
MSDYVLHVVSHTHWDREWYLTFQQFRTRLVDLMDNLLDILDRDPEFRYFNLDGQTIVLEDYLEIRPERRAVIEKHVRDGRILIGPWYQLNDEFLVSGESTIRSLLIGHRIAREFGPVMKVGYLPDQFGNISQMPQILNGFGIDNAIFGRGLQIDGDRKMEFLWRSPDGSEVLASLMAYWYNNAQRFPSDTDEAVAYAEDIRDRMKAISHVEHLLLMNGVDHLEAQPDLSGILARVNERLGKDRLEHSTLPKYVDGVRKSIARNRISLDTVVGELREDRRGSILAGTLSTRIYLKQANERCQTALEKYAEPASAFAYILGRGYPDGFLRYAWKLLMQNHPHDSICGCSIDQVHREMMPRFDQVEQVAEEMTGRALEAVAERVATEGDSVLVFNMLNWKRTDRVTARIDFPVGKPTRLAPTIDESLLFESIRILDEQGCEVPIAIISSNIIGKQVLDPHELPMAMMVKRFVIEFVAEDVPPCGYRTYRIEKTDRPPATDSAIASDLYWDNALASDLLRLSIAPNGSITLERLADEGSDVPCEVYGNLGIFEDTGDVGDEYLHIKPVNNSTVTTLCASPTVTVLDRGPVSTTLKIESSIRVPIDADSGASERSSQMIECPITSYITITRGVPRVDVRTVVENRAKDHRLRVLFPTGLSGGTVHAESQFDVVDRSSGVPAEWANASPFSPQRSWVDVSSDQQGLCVINKGLPEYEVYSDEGRTIALSLLRCVGTLSGGHEAPAAQATPEAQCLGSHTFEYSVYPHPGNWESAQVWKQAHQHNVPLTALQTGAHDGDLPATYSFVETSHAELVVSAIKKAEDSGMLVVRFYNTTAKEIGDAWVRVDGAKSAKLLNLNEEPIGDVAFRNGAASLFVGPKKIVTLGFEVR